MADQPYQRQVSGLILEPKPTSDPNDPLNWVSICTNIPVKFDRADWDVLKTQSRKHLNFALACYYVIIVLAQINIATSTWGPVQKELGFSVALLNDSNAVGCGALCVGAIVLVPFALKFGRRPVYILSLASLCGLSAWSAKMQNAADLMLVNILSSIVGSLAEVIVQMTVTDVYFVHERGLMNTLYFWFMTTGANLSTLVGGYITLSQGWRWVWWWMTILLGAGLVAFVFLYEETMFIRSIDGTGKENIETLTSPRDSLPTGQTTTGTAHIDYTIPKKTYCQKLELWSNSPISFDQLFKHIYQPFTIMATMSTVFFMAFLYGMMTACASVPIATLSTVMTLPPYSFTSAQIGLMGLSPFIGTSLAVLICGILSDWIAIYLSKKNEGIYEPEMRLWLALAFTPFVAAGIFMFGICLEKGLHWLLPAFGLAICAFGLVPASSAALTYLMDAYPNIIADAVVGVTFLRNIIATVFVFVLQPWVDRVGLAWFYVAFGLITTFVMMCNLIFIVYGKSLRAKSTEKYKHFSTNKLE
ncbi:hypothetical protein N7495_000881 [Penicillium taxi]|uniref:uncharacterized protein n=1 Tax=Penicillium taxi TaxID=168475 RepID=UPI002545073A|nr:uncharacterized protein N7495_000881 [Penicillium taxi]KAJ5908199.1 hypothetical protein N7495_000881 [Penicillium taxi]